VVRTLARSAGSEGTAGPESAAAPAPSAGSAVRASLSSMSVSLSPYASYSDALRSQSPSQRTIPSATNPRAGAPHPVTVVAAPPNKEVIFIPPRLDIIARGGIDQLAKITPESFQATIDYRALVEDSANAIYPALQGPAGVKVVSRKPERFQFIIRSRL